MEFGARFTKWGLGLFLFGVFLTFGIIGHYCTGARWPTGELFKANIALWWACPWTLSVAAVQAGGLGMVALGVARLVAARLAPDNSAAWSEPIALLLCVAGLLGVFLVGYPGYFVFDAIWPSFFYSPVAVGKNAWLLSQGLFIAVYLLGALLMFNAVRHALDSVAATTIGNASRHVGRSGVTGALALVAMSTLVQAETVDTRIGKLEIENGFPTKATAEKLFDAMDFQRATQAYIWALPAVGFHGLHLAHLNTFGAKDGDVVLYQTLKDKAGMLTPNLTTLYLMSFWNLADQGPMVVEVPAGVTAGGFLDIWQRPITDTGQTGPDRGGGGKYLIVPPGSDIREMRGYIVARSPSNQVWFAVRVLDRDPKMAEEVARKHKVYAWGQRDNPPPTKFIPVGGRDWASAQPAGLDYWAYLSDVIQPEPIEARDTVMFGMLVPLGVEKGKPFSPNERQRKILTDAAQLGELMARTNAYEKRYANATVWPGKKWDYANIVELDQENNYSTQLDERGAWYYEAIGNTAGMQGRILNFGQVYLEASKDKDGKWLDGGKTYRLRVPANPPVVQFWSFTVYDNVTRGPVITPQGAADISSRTEGLVTNADGSVDLYFGPQKPAGVKVNYVQTLPNKGWFTYFRLYGPKEAYFDKSWQLPDIEPLPEGVGARALQ